MTGRQKTKVAKKNKVVSSGSSKKQIKVRVSSSLGDKIPRKKKKALASAEIKKRNKKRKILTSKIYKDKTRKRIDPKTVQSNNKLIDNRIINEELERQKRWVMWSGVVFFMILIATFWVYNLSQTFSVRQGGSAEDSVLTSEKINQATKLLDQKLKELNNDIKSVKQTTLESRNKQISTSTDLDIKEKNIFKATENNKANTQAITTETTNNQEILTEIKILKNRLNELEDNLNKEKK